MRTPLRKFHKEYSPYQAYKSTKKAIEEARANEILIGPSTYTNTGTDVQLFLEEKDHSLTFKKWEMSLNDPSVTYSVLLTGAHSLLIFKNGANILTFADSIKPSFPSSKKIENIKPTKRGKLSSDPYPHGWTKLDWKVFHEMRDPMLSFPKVAAKLDVTWQTVRNHFNKVISCCKPWISFFPNGLPNYYHVFLTFKTDYEIGIYEELRRLDRTSFIYKFEGTIGLFLYAESSLEHFVFLELEKKGIIHDLHVSIPVQWHKPWFKF
ncbi:MAG: hypothetical protein AYK18_15060 [Theionarchaea archaeon DG-70]|nr:MAG: hypothetical protein AYK18_15060 [Theionarchaea archaeon DG-70]